jgi:isopenicillin N synthase-like dioxygenase
LVHYPFNPDAEDGHGIGAHTDYECFTLLKPTAPGLEVLNGAGEWIDVLPVDGTFVVNIGDMLELWTDGAFVATSHRVRKVVEERYSFPLFFNVDYHTEVKPLPQFATDGATTRPALRAGEHLFAQTAQTFAYLRNRIDSGELVLPDGSLTTGQFGQQARYGGNDKPVS